MSNLSIRPTEREIADLQTAVNQVPELAITLRRILFERDIARSITTLSPSVEKMLDRLQEPFGRLQIQRNWSDSNVMYTVKAELYVNPESGDGVWKDYSAEAPTPALALDVLAAKIGEAK